MAQPTQELPDWMSYSTFTTGGIVTQTIVNLPLTYYGPSIPLGTDGVWTYGGLTSPPPSTAAPTSPTSVSSVPSASTSGVSSIPSSPVTSSSLPIPTSSPSTTTTSTPSTTTIPPSTSSATSLPSSASSTSPIVTTRSFPSIGTSSSVPSQSVSPIPTTTSSERTGLSATVIILIIVGVVLLLLLLLALCFLAARRRNRRLRRDVSAQERSHFAIATTSDEEDIHTRQSLPPMRQNGARIGRPIVSFADLGNGRPSGNGAPAKKSSSIDPEDPYRDYFFHPSDEQEQSDAPSQIGLAIAPGTSSEEREGLSPPRRRQPRVQYPDSPSETDERAQLLSTRPSRRTQLPSLVPTSILRQIGRRPADEMGRRNLDREVPSAGTGSTSRDDLELGARRASYRASLLGVQEAQGSSGSARSGPSIYHDAPSRPRTPQNDYHSAADAYRPVFAPPPLAADEDPLDDILDQPPPSTSFVTSTPAARRIVSATLPRRVRSGTWNDSSEGEDGDDELEQGPPPPESEWIGMSSASGAERRLTLGQPVFVIQPPPGTIPSERGSPHPPSARSLRSIPSVPSHRSGRPRGRVASGSHASSSANNSAGSRGNGSQRSASVSSDGRRVRAAHSMSAFSGVRSVGSTTAPEETLSFGQTTQTTADTSLGVHQRQGFLQPGQALESPRRDPSRTPPPPISAVGGGTDRPASGWPAS